MTSPAQTSQFERLLQCLDKLVEIAVGAALSALIVMTFGQVVARYVFSHSFYWVLEVSVLLLVWMTMLSGYIGIRRNIHIAADFLVARLNDSVRRVIAVLVYLLCIAFVLTVGWHSIAVVDAMRGMFFTSIAIEQSVLYLALPVGMALMLIALMARVYANITTGAT